MKRSAVSIAWVAIVAVSAWVATGAGVEGDRPPAEKLAEALTAETFRPALAEQPAYQGDPEYFCLVFGEPENQVWGVFDQSKMGLRRYLYIDLNANGDLTDEGERIEQPRNDGRGFSEIDFVQFPPMELRLPDAAAPVPLTVYRFGEALYCYIHRDGHFAVTRPGDAESTITLGSSVEEAPVFHFDGPLTFRPSRPFQPVPGQEVELFVELGTPCELGDTFTAVSYTCLPDDVTPRGTLTYTNSSGEQVSVDFSLSSRC